MPARPRRQTRGTSTPRARPRSSGRGGSPPRQKTPGAPRDPSCFPCPPKGREEEGEVVPGGETPEEVSARGEVGGAVGTEPEGREDVLRIVSTLLNKLFPLSRRPKAQMSQNMSLAQTLPLHLVQVGWVSRSTNDRKSHTSYHPPLGKSV